MNPEGYSILLIEDDLDIHHAVRAMLPKPEFRVVCCNNGPTGLEALRRNPPDLVLLDIMLATPSEGFHICYEMKEDHLHLEHGVFKKTRGCAASRSS